MHPFMRDKRRRKLLGLRPISRREYNLRVRIRTLCQPSDARKHPYMNTSDTYTWCYIRMKAQSG